MSTNGMVDPVSPEARLAKLEADFAVLSWLYAEMMYGVRLATAMQLAQTPQMQQRLVEQIMAAQSP